MIIKNNKKLKQEPFKTEKELQNFVEKNIEEILNFIFIETEFSVGEFRIDTLAFDMENKAFKIIEYKKAKNNSLVDQGYTYLNVMMDRKADFVLKYNEKTSSILKITDVDWSATRIIFVSPDFTKYQLNAVIENMPFELYKIKKYHDGIVYVSKIEKLSKSNTRGFELINVTEKEQNNIKEVRVYTEEEHLVGKPQQLIELYEDLKLKVMDLGDVDFSATKLYLSFKANRRIAEVWVKNNCLDVYLNLQIGELEDPFNIASDASYLLRHGTNKGYLVTIKNKDDIDKAMFLIKQSYEVNKK